MVTKLDIETYCNRYEELIAIVRSVERRAYSEAVSEKLRTRIQSICKEIKELEVQRYLKEIMLEHA